MAALNLENVPDDLYACIRDLATQKNLSLNDLVIQVLKQAFQATPTTPQVAAPQPQSFVPATEVLTRIRSRSRVNPTNFGLPDSTTLLQEDRSR
jgi:hypothetical protein